MSFLEKLLMPAAGTLLFFLMSGGFMLAAKGATSRMKIVLRCATIFAAGMTYSMFWHKELAEIFNWQDAWIATTFAAAVGSVFLGRHWFNKQRYDSEYDSTS